MGRLFLAALSGRDDSIAGFLIQKGADLQGEVISKKNALNLASEIGNLAVVQAALQKGEVDKIDHALSRTIKGRHDSIARALIEHDVDIDTEAGRHTVAIREKQRKVIREWHARHGVPPKEHWTVSQECNSRRPESNAAYHSRRRHLIGSATWGDRLSTTHKRRETGDELVAIDCGSGWIPSQFHQSSEARR
jgi:hypothetical protein